MTRSELLNKLETQEEWDVVVIGGGATGLGIALEAASRKYKVLLVEQSDFAKSTSSKSTKLIHGGVRYLAQGHFGLVREASIERAYLLRNAPHLVRNQTFIIPIYKRSDAFKYTIGLKIYDWIAGTSSLGKAQFISREKILIELPNINPHQLIGGVVYHDGQFDDARLAINLAQTILDERGVPINYMKVIALNKNNSGILTGVQLKDNETGKHYSINSKAVVNATGVFADDILQMDNAVAEKTIQVSQGTHIVIDKKFSPSRNAMMIPKTPDGRVLFLIPWYDKIVVGTTDSPVSIASLEPIPSAEEIQFILETASMYLENKPGRKDVESVFSGLRPLAAQKEQTTHTKEISRNYKIIVSPSFLFTIVGGKWTTYRKMGEDMVNRIEKKLNWEKRKPVTASLHIHGWKPNADNEGPHAFYGKDAEEIDSAIKNAPDDWISISLHLHKAQVIWAVEHEMARTVEDVLARRTRALLLDAKQSSSLSPRVASIMAEILGKDQPWIDQQVMDYSSLVKNYILV
ncbi:MAG TPA: glycerol-3-phosphate dehydrogenase/oxidase [Chitinophagaceae bacterium]|nr:glycerol-3-phosphate dehydrogenase/oxidase [Chitinophagaceae bacterium]